MSCYLLFVQSPDCVCTDCLQAISASFPPAPNALASPPLLCLAPFDQPLALHLSAVFSFPAGHHCNGIWYSCCLKAVRSQPTICYPLVQLLPLAVQAISDEALAFQREKQTRLNQVEVVLLLSLHQIQFLQENGQVPSDLSGALLFSSAELDKLKRRVHVGHSLGCLGVQIRPL